MRSVAWLRGSREVSSQNISSSVDGGYFSPTFFASNFLGAVFCAGRGAAALSGPRFIVFQRFYILLRGSGRPPIYTYFYPSRRAGVDIPAWTGRGSGRAVEVERLRLRRRRARRARQTGLFSFLTTPQACTHTHAPYATHDTRYKAVHGRTHTSTHESRHAGPRARATGAHRRSAHAGPTHTYMLCTHARVRRHEAPLRTCGGGATPARRL
jgi:hypothetical protein